MFTLRIGFAKILILEVFFCIAIYIKMPSGNDIVMDGRRKWKGDVLVAFFKK